MFKIKLPVLACFLLLSSVATAAASNKEPLPVESFASLPKVTSIKISPDGRHIASFVRLSKEEKEGTAVLLVNNDTGKSELLLFADDKELTLSSFKWANNKNLLLHASFPDVRYGTRTRENRLIVIDIKTKKHRHLFTKKLIKAFGMYPQIQDHIVDILPNSSSHILLALTEEDSIYNSVFRVSIEREKLKRVQKRIKGSFDWVTDRSGDIRICLTRNDTTYRILHRPTNKKKWTTLWEFEAFSREQVWPIGFGDSNNELYVSALHEGRDAIFAIDLADKTLQKKLVHSNPKYDVNGSLIYSKKTKSVVGLYTDIEEHIFWEDSLISLNNGLNQALPDTYNYIVSMSDDEQKYILYTTSTTEPGTYYIGNRKDNSLTPIAKKYPTLTSDILSQKEKTKYKARDSLAIEAFLTFPKNGTSKKNLPTIIFPHGGPISYDGHEFDYWTQFFANRGYAVFQMNFRGSSGYGYDFMTAGLQGWGKEMQTDIEDGTKWLIEQGYADPNRICIVGASYGGYAALMAAAATPKLYQCVISFAGVTDLPQLVKSQRKYTNYDIVKEQIGTDFKDMKHRSPYYNAASIQAPTLLIHGEKDRVVDLKQSKKMYKSLKSEKKEVTFIELEEGSHYLAIETNRIRTFKAMEAFLAEHLP